MKKERKNSLKHPESEASFFDGIGVSVILFSIVIIAGIIYALNRDTPSEKKPSGNSQTISNVPKIPTSPTASLEKIQYSSLRHVQGKGTLTFVEYSDMSCEFCKRFHITVSQVMKKYDGKIAYSYKHYPLNNQETGRQIAIASECADNQKAFFPFVENAFTQKTVDANALAKKSGLDEKTFESCLNAQEMTTRIDNDMQEALATGASGAPWSLVVDGNGKIVMRFKGAIGKKRLQEALDLALKDQKNE